MFAKKISLFIATSLMCSALLFTSCKKDSTAKVSDTEAAENNALAESSFNDVTTISDQAALGGSVNLRVAGDASADREDGLLGACSTVTVDTVSVPHVITVDFGTTNCVCNDGRNRRGKIILTYTGRYRESGTVINISFNNYFVNDNQLTGTKKITNQGPNGAGNIVYKVEVNGQVIKANDGGTVTWVSTRFREWIAGSNTPLIISDDVYSITGNASGTNKNGKSYTINITKALVRKMNCRWFESGTVDVTPDGKVTRTLDYGNTGCDANATVSILGYSFPIVLK